MRPPTPRELQARPAEAPETAPHDGSSPSDAFKCRGVSVDFTTRGKLHRVVEDIGFSVRPGEFVSLLGPSGTGKTTLLRVLGGLQKPANGSKVEFDGTPVTRPPEGVVVVFQDYWSSLLPWRTRSGCSACRSWCCTTGSRASRG